MSEFSDKKKQKAKAARELKSASRFAYAASATPPGVSGLAVIRMSGESSFDIADEIFKNESAVGVTVGQMKGYTCAYGSIIDPDTGNIVDKVILTKFAAPHSYTGENTVEISCHGGIYVREKILELLYAGGARPAQPGEFSRNAFLNGKIDLAQGEAIMDLISSTASKAGLAAINQLRGRLSSELRRINEDIYRVLARIEMILEYPEEEEGIQEIEEEIEEERKREIDRDRKKELGKDEKRERKRKRELNKNKDKDKDKDGDREGDKYMEEIKSSADDIYTKIRNLIDSFRQGRILKEGFTVVIAGRPNAGKSSLLNAIAGFDRSIVTDIPGTTRDTIEEMTQIGGIPVRLIDTAGLRDSEDVVEQIGVKRAKEALENADLILWVLDEEVSRGDSLLSEYEELTGKTCLSQSENFAIVLSKIDIKPFDENLKALKDSFPNIPVIPFSAVSSEGLDEIKELVVKIYDKLGSPSSQEVIITNSRHIVFLEEAAGAVDMARDGLKNGLPMDVLAAALRKGAESLAEITGDEVSERLIQEIFDRFCVGK